MNLSFIQVVLLSPWSIAGWGPHHFCSAISMSCLHLLQSSAILSHSMLLRSVLTLSLHLNFCLPLLPPSSIFHALSQSFRSHSLYVSCPSQSASYYLHFRRFVILISSLNFLIFLLSSCFSLHILLTQLFCAICSSSSF